MDIFLSLSSRSEGINAVMDLTASTMYCFSQGCLETNILENRKTFSFGFRALHDGIRKLSVPSKRVNQVGKERREMVFDLPFTQKPKTMPTQPFLNFTSFLLKERESSNRSCPSFCTLLLPPGMGLYENTAVRRESESSLQLARPGLNFLAGHHAERQPLFPSPLCPRMSRVIAILHFLWSWDML